MALGLAAATNAAAVDPFAPQETARERQQQDAVLMGELLGQYASAQSTLTGATPFAHAGTGVRLASADCSQAAHDALAGQFGQHHKHPHGRMFNFAHAPPGELLSNSAVRKVAAARVHAASKRRAKAHSAGWMRRVVPATGSDHDAKVYDELQELLRRGHLLGYRRRARDAFGSVCLKRSRNACGTCPPSLPFSDCRLML